MEYKGGTRRWKQGVFELAGGEGGATLVLRQFSSDAAGAPLSEKVVLDARDVRNRPRKRSDRFDVRVHGSDGSGDLGGGGDDGEGSWLCFAAPNPGAKERWLEQALPSRRAERLEQQLGQVRTQAAGAEVARVAAVAEAAREKEAASKAREELVRVHRTLADQQRVVARTTTLAEVLRGAGLMDEVIACTVDALRKHGFPPLEQLVALPHRDLERLLALGGGVGVGGVPAFAQHAMLEYAKAQRVKRQPQELAAGERVPTPIEDSVRALGAAVLATAEATDAGVKAGAQTGGGDELLCDDALHWRLLPRPCANAQDHCKWEVQERASAGGSEWFKVDVPIDEHQILQLWDFTHDVDGKLKCLPAGKKELHVRVYPKPKAFDEPLQEHWTVVYTCNSVHRPWFGTGARFHSEIRILSANGQPTRDLRGIAMPFMWLKGLDFGGCDLTSAYFFKCKMQDANFDLATLNGINFRHTTLIGANFLESKCDKIEFLTADGTMFNEAQLPRQVTSHKRKAGVGLATMLLKHATDNDSSNDDDSDSGSDDGDEQEDDQEEAGCTIGGVFDGVVDGLKKCAVEQGAKILGARAQRGIDAAACVAGGLKALAEKGAKRVDSLHEKCMKRIDKLAPHLASKFSVLVDVVAVPLQQAQGVMAVLSDALPLLELQPGEAQGETEIQRAVSVFRSWFDATKALASGASGNDAVVQKVGQHAKRTKQVTRLASALRRYLGQRGTSPEASRASTRTLRTACKGAALEFSSGANGSDTLGTANSAQKLLTALAAHVFELQQKSEALFGVLRKASDPKQIAIVLRRQFQHKSHRLSLYTQALAHDVSTKDEGGLLRGLLTQKQVTATCRLRA